MRKIPTCDWMQEILILEGIDEGVNCLMSEKKNDWKKMHFQQKINIFVSLSAKLTFQHCYGLT